MAVPGQTDLVSADSLISPGRMILILTDVHVAEAALHAEQNSGPGPKRGPEFYYAGIFRKYHISPARYEQNLAHYRQNPGEYAKMYEKVIAIIESQKKNFPATE
jgi:hypothetical protein